MSFVYLSKGIPRKCTYNNFQFLVQVKLSKSQKRPDRASTSQDKNHADLETLAIAKEHFTSFVMKNKGTFSGQEICLGESTLAIKTGFNIFLNDKTWTHSEILWTYMYIRIYYTQMTYYRIQFLRI